MSSNTTLNEGGTNQLFQETRLTLELFLKLNQELKERADALRKLIEKEGNPVIHQEYLKNLRLLTDVQENLLLSSEKAGEALLPKKTRMILVQCP